jgi:hypothetical protein
VVGRNRAVIVVSGAMRDRCLRERFCPMWHCAASPMGPISGGDRAIREVPMDVLPHGPGTEPEEVSRREVALALAALPPELRAWIAEQGRKESLAEEIGALRAVLACLLATDGADAGRLSQSVPRVVNAIVRALRVQRLLAGETAGDLNEMLTRILADLGHDE